MKKILVLSLALLAVVGCQKKDDCPCNTASDQSVSVTVQVQGTTMTKASGVEYADEARVSNLQILAFNAYGELESYVTVDNETSATLLASSGQKTVWAVVNAPSLASIEQIEDLQEAVSNLSDNALNAFVMTGNVTEELTDGAVINITVKRIVAKVSIEKITAAFPDTPAYAGKDLVVTGIYMLNVGAAQDYPVAAAPAAWYNKLYHLDEEADTFLYDALSETIANNTSYAVAHDYYPYPNSVDVSVLSLDPEVRGTWSPRRSILCIEVTFGGEVGYYPIEMPVIQRNKHYRILEVILSRRPGSLPYVPIETGNATVTITVDDWEEVIIPGNTTEPGIIVIQ